MFYIILMILYTTKESIIKHKMLNEYVFTKLSIKQDN